MRFNITYSYDFIPIPLLNCIIWVSNLSLHAGILSVFPGFRSIWFFFLFPECVARVPVSLWGSGGWGCVRSTLPNRSQPFARSPYGRAYGKFCRRGHFWRFQTSRCFVSSGRRGTSWHSDVFCNVSKVVLCGRRNTFATVSQDKLQIVAVFRGRRSTLDVSSVILHGGRNTLDVSCCVFCANRIVRAASSMAFCEMWWKLTEASHETSILR